MKVVDRAASAVGLSAFGTLTLGLSLAAAMGKSPTLVLFAAISTVSWVFVGFHLGRLPHD